MSQAHATIEVVEQLRGQAGERQIDGAEIALCNGNGGLCQIKIDFDDVAAFS